MRGLKFVDGVRESIARETGNTLSDWRVLPEPVFGCRLWKLGDPALAKRLAKFSPRGGEVWFETEVRLPRTMLGVPVEKTGLFLHLQLALWGTVYVNGKKAGFLEGDGKVRIAKEVLRSGKARISVQVKRPDAPPQLVACSLGMGKQTSLGKELCAFRISLDTARHLLWWDKIYSSATLLSQPVEVDRSLAAASYIKGLRRLLVESLVNFDLRLLQKGKSKEFRRQLEVTLKRLAPLGRICQAISVAGNHPGPYRCCLAVALAGGEGSSQGYFRFGSPHSK